MKRKDITKTLELVKPATSDQLPVPIFNDFIFGGGVVYAWNDQLAIMGPCPIQEYFAVKGATLFGFLTNSRAKEVSFTISGDDIIIKTGKSKMTMPYSIRDTFLFEEPDDNWDVELQITPELMEGIKICLVTSSEDFSLPALMGVSVIITKNVHLYSCDSDAVSRYLIGKAKKKMNEGYYTLPNEFCHSFMRVFNKSAAASGVISINKEWAKAEFNNKYKVYGRVIENDDPINYEKLIARTLKSEPDYIKIPKGLNYALLRARVVADVESKRTIFNIKDNKLRLNTETEIGNVKDVVKLREDHPDIEVAVNSSLVQRSTLLCEQMAILDNCTCYKSGATLFQILSNYE